MNWRLIFQLSLFGLAMGIATVFLIPSNIEPIFWAVIFIVCAYMIGKQCEVKHFLHGLLLGLANSIWITACHMIFFSQYIATHPQEAAMMTRMPLQPRAMMALTGPIIGLITGVVMGLLALIASKIIKRSPTA